MTALHEWEDAHPEVEVVSSMPLVSRNYAEQVRPMSVYEQADELVRTRHRVETNSFGWGCECGKGTEWPLAPVTRAKAAAEQHLRSEWHRAVRELREAAR